MLSRIYRSLYKVRHAEHKYLSVRSYMDHFEHKDLIIKKREEGRAPPPPNTDFEFKSITSDHMLQADWNQVDGWGKPQILPYAPFTLDPRNISTDYAPLLCSVGFKAFRDVHGNIRTCASDRHISRLGNKSAQKGMPSFNPLELEKCIMDLLSVDNNWVPKASLNSIFIQSTIISTGNISGTQKSKNFLMFTILYPISSYSTGSFSPISLYFEHSARSWATPLCLKWGFVNRNKRNLDQVLWIEDGRWVSETVSQNIFFVLKDPQGVREIITPSLGGAVTGSVEIINALHMGTVIYIYIYILYS